MREVFGNTITVLVLCSAVMGCGDQSGTPQPVPIPGALRVSDAPPNLPMAVTIIGLPGAVAGAGTVLVDVGSVSVDVGSRQNGSFIAEVRAKGGDMLRVRFEDSAATEITVQPRIGIQVTPPPGEQQGVAPIVRSGSTVTVRGLAALSAPRVIGINRQLGLVVTAPVETDRSFTFEIDGQAGDAILVYHDASPLGGAWMLAVP